jgi:bacillithiol biosynthesis cysteine-adding enzyme BshC
VEAGYHTQVASGAGNLALFHLDGRRTPIRSGTEGFIIDERTMSPAELAREVDAHADHFSPSVLLRPIVQDAIFPTACYVAGPNELAYLAQLREVYGHFGVPMPLIYPRASATIVDRAAYRFLTKYALPLEALQAQDEAALNDLLKSQMPPSVEESFAEATRAIDAQMAAVIGAVPSVDPTLEGAARTTLTRMRHDLENLHAKVIQAAKRRDETLRRQFMRTRAQAFPDGHAQERSVGFVSLLNRYGPALVERLQAELPLEVGRHWVVTL